MERYDSPILEWPGDEPGVIQPPRPRPGGPRVPERVVLCFFKDVVDERVRAGSLAPLLRLPGEGDPVQVFRQVGGAEPEVAVAFPGIGAPFAAATLEELIGLGGRRFVACGGAGALAPELALGQVVVVTAALRGEGTSYHYLRAGRFALPDAQVTADIEAACQAAAAPFVRGATWTTDAVFRETRAAVRRRRAEGCVVVEMEAAAFFAVAQYRQVAFGQLLYAGDDVSGEQWDSRGWLRQTTVRSRLFELALDACRGDAGRER